MNSIPLTVNDNSLLGMRLVLGPGLSDLGFPVLRTDDGVLGQPVLAVGLSSLVNLNNDNKQHSPSLWNTNPDSPQPNLSASRTESLNVASCLGDPIHNSRPSRTVKRLWYSHEREKGRLEAD